jgi:hypothetical protein
MGLPEHKAFRQLQQTRFLQFAGQVTGHMHRAIRRGAGWDSNGFSPAVTSEAVLHGFGKTHIHNGVEVVHEASQVLAHGARKETAETGGIHVKPRIRHSQAAGYLADLVSAQQRQPGVPFSLESLHGGKAQNDIPECALVDNKDLFTHAHTP